MTPAEPDSAVPHESRLNRALRELLATQRVAALGTLSGQGKPFVSMVPFAVEPHSGAIIIHVSLLAPHTRHLMSDSSVSMLVMQAEVPGEPVHALPRVSLDGTAARLQPDGAAWQAAKSAYLARFPDAQMMTQLGDFSFFAITALAARHVAGFGAARSLAPDDLASVLKPR